MISRTSDFFHNNKIYYAVPKKNPYRKLKILSFYINRKGDVPYIDVIEIDTQTVIRDYDINKIEKIEIWDSRNKQQTIYL